MTLLVLSDSHGRADRVRAAMALNPDAAAVFFLGDGLRDLPEAERCPILRVKGNCDVFTLFDTEPAPEERLEFFGGKRLLAMHGHTRSVKSGIMGAATAGLEANADIVLFGHTHNPLEYRIPEGEKMFGRELERPLYLFNPGSIGAGEFGLITLQGGEVLLSHGRLEK